ncbi:MAG: CheR family methyltransferase [Sandaracinaceae bacterium]
MEGKPIIVAVGASAGGLEALRGVFDAASADTNLAFIVAQHLSPDYRSLMVELLARHTQLTVRLAEDGAKPRAGCIDLISPQTLLRLKGGHLAVEQLDERSNLRPIDTLMISVAEDCGEGCAGVILSGTGSDGSVGMAAIRREGGITVVQDPQTASFDGMPRSALRDHDVDLVLPPNRIISELLQFQPESRSRFFKVRGSAEESPGLSRILRALRRASGIDFNLYKPATIVRRIERRMVQLNLDSPAAYLERLQEDTREIADLCNDMLINVTRFFRDTGAVEAFKRDALPRLVAGPNKGPIRVWVAGCATGEEAYSVAIMLTEALEAAKSTREARVFATDVDATALDHAARGEYSLATVEPIPPALLEKYFKRVGSKYVVQKHLRDTLLFSRHDVTEDPPFSRLDLITCRNMLIYFRVPIQERVLRVFSASLNDEGILWLGSSETVGVVAGHFESLDSRWKLYQALPGRERVLDYRIVKRLSARKVAPRIERGGERVVRGLRAAMDGYVPPTLIVDRDFRLIHRVGDVGRLLRVPAGHATLDVRQMLPREITAVLAAARTRALESEQDVVYRSLRVQTDGSSFEFDLRMRKIPGDGLETGMFALFFETLSEQEPLPAQDIQPADVPSDLQAQLEATEHELRDTRENLQTSIEEVESANEELQSTNEELMASNEELQSTNEELQSVNEELHTVNSEHQEKVRELSEVTMDLDGVLSSIEASILVLSRDLNIRRYNQAATRVFNLIPEDTGRPLAHITHQLSLPDLPAICERVALVAHPELHHSEADDQRHMMVQVTPRLSGGSVEGVLITCTDVTTLFNAERRVEAVTAALSVAELPLCTVSGTGEITAANAAFAKASGRDLQWVVGQDIRDLSHEGERANIESGLAAVRGGSRWSSVVRSKRPDGETYWENVDLIPVPSKAEGVAAIRLSTTLAAIRDDRVEETPADAHFVWNLASDRVSGTYALAAVFRIPKWSGGPLSELAAHMSPEDLDALRQASTAAETLGRPFRVTCAILAEGHTHEVEIRCQPILHTPAGEAMVAGRCRSKSPRADG